MGSNLSRPLSEVPNHRWPALSRAMLSTESPLRPFGVLGVVHVARAAFGPGVESVHARIGGNPQVAVIVFQEISDEVVAQAPGIVHVVLVDDEGVTVIAVEAVAGGEPHEAAAILQDVGHSVLGEAIGSGEMGEREVSRPRMAAVGGYRLSGARFGGRRIRRGNGAQQQDPDRTLQAPRRPWADGDHGTIQWLFDRESTTGLTGPVRPNRCGRNSAAHPWGCAIRGCWAAHRAPPLP